MGSCQVTNNILYGVMSGNLSFVFDHPIIKHLTTFCMGSCQVTFHSYLTIQSLTHGRIVHVNFTNKIIMHTQWTKVFT